MNGGIFVNEQNNIKPNPYLKNNSKLDSTGKRMIKINPAWMTRQLSTLSNKEGNYYYKIGDIRGGIRVSIPIDEYNVSIETIDEKEFYYSSIIIIISIIFILLLQYIIHLTFIYKNQKEEIKLKDDLLIHAQSIANFGFWKSNFKENTLVWSKEIYNTLELDQKKVKPTYKLFQEMIHIDDRKMVDEAYLNSLKTKQPYEITHRIKNE